MLRFLFLRFLQALGVLLGMSAVIFLLIGSMPGDPVDLLIGSQPGLSPEGVARLRALHGLDLPLWQRYLHWLEMVLGGNFGHSRLYARPVVEVLPGPLLNTLVLVGISLLVAALIAFPAGIAAARGSNRCGSNRWRTILIDGLCFTGIALPPFWLALMLILVFAVGLGWLPAGGTGGQEETTGLGGLTGLIDRATHLVLPVATLALVQAAAYTRYIKAALSETLQHDFIRTARAKGLSETAVIHRHALRPAMIPVVTIFALDLGSLVSGALITETMFSWPGMGKLIYEAVLGNDYPLALAALLAATAATLMGSLLADLAYAALDPRISLGKSGDSR